MGEHRKLPAPDFCNREGGGKMNPIYGMGALGNQYTGRMFYSGSEAEKEQWTMLAQQMLLDLGISVGPKGADGKFGNDTEKAVKQFQDGHDDWGGEKLNVDGLIGPETSDALNRSMVAVDGWYDRHQTEKELTATFSLLTVRSDALKNPVSFDVADMEKGKVVVVGKIPPRAPEVFLIIRLIDGSRKPMKQCPYTLEIDSPDFERVTDKTDDNGMLKQQIPPDAASGKLILEACTFDLTIEKVEPADSEEGAAIRLANLGYPTGPESGGNAGDTLETALLKFQKDAPCEETGVLDEPTVKKLEEAYGS